MSASGLKPVFAALGLLAGCSSSTGATDPNAWPRWYCANESIQVSGSKTSNFTLGNERFLSPDQTCWVFDYQEDPATLSGNVTLQRVRGTDGDRTFGCEFSGVSNQVRADLSKGRCTIPIDGGYQRFELTAPASFNPKAENGSNVTLEGDWFEYLVHPIGSTGITGGDVVRGHASLQLTAHSVTQSAPVAGYPDSAKKRVTLSNDWPSCGAPRCFQVAFHGKGTLVSGTTEVCGRLLDSFADRFPIVIDERGFMAFASRAADVPEDSWLKGGPLQSGCGIHAFGQQRPYPFQGYDVSWDASGAGEMHMDLTMLYTTNNVSDVCRTQWVTSLSPCP